tara:strand:+ start:3907 stop:4383 length:477 start_codon:yes stop_codon:yes gene_type:complete
MFDKEIKILNSKYQKWFNILHHFGCPADQCQDIIQDMYLKVYIKLTEGVNIMFINDEINYYYIYKILRSTYIDKVRKEKGVFFVSLVYLEQSESDPDNAQLYESVESELKTMYWYDRKVFEIISSGESILKLAKKTNISYHSLYHTFKKVKKHIKKLL